MAGACTVRRGITRFPVGTVIRTRQAASAQAFEARLLSACGIIAALVPPIEVGDPLGVHGRVVTAALRDGGLTTQSVGHVDTTRTLDVPDLEAKLHGFTLAGFHTNAGLTHEVRLSDPMAGSASDDPASITLTLTFDRHVCAVDGRTYVYAGTTPLVNVLDVEVTDRDSLALLVAILVAGETETPNQGTFRVAIEVEADAALTGVVATFQPTSTGSTIRSGG